MSGQTTLTGKQVTVAAGTSW